MSWRALASSPFVSIALSFAVALTWATSTPMFGAPDERSHLVRAAAAARGDLDGVELATGGGLYRATGSVRPQSTIPGAAGRGDVCYAGNSRQSADCLILSSDRRDQLVSSSAGGYPPFYYLVVGWPSRLWSGAFSLYLMRAVGCLLFSLMLGLAASTLRRSRSTPIGFVGLAVAATPMVWFLGSSVNPSAMAIGAGIAAWCGGWFLASEDAEPASAAWRFALPLCLLLLSRRDSLLWGTIVAGGVAALVPRRRIPALLRSPHVLGWGAACLLCLLFTWRSAAGYGSTLVAEEATTGSAAFAWGRLITYFQEMIGVLGWLDTSLPRPAYLLWEMTFGALALVALGVARPRVNVVLAAVVGVVVAAIVLIGAQRFPYFQGRYALPAVVGVPLLCGLGLSSPLRGVARRPVVVPLVVLFVIDVLAFCQQYRRYAFSGETTWWIFDGGRWAPPPAPFAVLLVLHLVGLGLLFGHWMVLADGPSGWHSPPRPAGKVESQR